MAKAKSELEDMTKDELVAYADDQDIDVQHSWLKDEIISEIMKGEKAAAKEAKPDSIKHNEDRKAKIEAENDLNAATAKEAAENKEIASFKGLPKEGETRDQLLDRIRKMREPAPPPVDNGLTRSPGLQTAYELEVKAGQEAVAKAEATAAQYRDQWAKEEAEGEKKKGSDDPGVSPQS